MIEYNFVSLGAGVQSSTLALRFKELTGKKCNGFIFADTKFEPPGVYKYLEFLKKELGSHLVHTCTAPRDN